MEATEDTEYAKKGEWLYVLGQHHFDDALRCTHEAAEKGYAEAQTQLGVCYLYGFRVNKNKEKAVELFKAAAGDFKNDGGDSNAQYYLGVCHFGGIGGLWEDKKEAKRWFKKALKPRAHASSNGQSSNPDAQYCLAECYEYFDKMPKAVKWYRAAAAQGHVEAQNYLKQLFQ